MRFIKVTCLSFGCLLSGCSWLYGENGLIHDSSNDYLKSSQTADLKIPQNYDTSSLKDELKIPPLSAQAQSQPMGDDLVKAPPLQILAVSQGMRINRNSDSPSVFWMGSQEQLSKYVEEFLNSKESKFTSSSNVFQTGWLVTDNGAWWRTVFGSDLPELIRNQYQLALSAGERPGEQKITVQLLAHQQKAFGSDDWQKHPSKTVIATEFLNEFVGYLDYLERKENANRLQQLSRGFVIRLGKDVENNAAYIAESDWQTVWLKSPKVLEPFGFTLSDKDQSTGTYFFEFEANEPGFFASLVGDEEAVALDLPKGAYQLVIGGKEQGAVTLTIIDTEGNPLTDAKMAQLFAPISQAYGKNTRREKIRRK